MKRPPEWKRGKKISIISLEWSSKNMSAFKQLKNVFLWDRTAPFGFPIVPDVYMITCGSSGFSGPRDMVIKAF